jgi:hypothetical protein
LFGSFQPAKVLWEAKYKSLITFVHIGSLCSLGNAPRLVVLNINSLFGYFNNGRLEVVPIPFAQPTYRVRQVQGATKLDMTGITHISPCDDCTINVTLPFTFRFFNRDYNSVVISSEGNMQFATRFGGHNINPLPDGASEMEPFIAYFYTDFYPASPTARGYKTFGTPPNRYFVVSLNNSAYCSSYGGTVDTVVTADTILYETSNLIEMRYYRVDTIGQTVVIGVDDVRSLINDEPDFAVFANAVTVDSTFANRLTNTTLLYEFIPMPVWSSSSSTGGGPVGASSSPSIPTECISNPATLPTGSITFELVFSVPYTNAQQINNFMPIVQQSVRTAIQTVAGTAAAAQLVCGVYRTAMIANAYIGSSQETVATVHIYNITGGDSPTTIATHLLHLITSNQLRSYFPPSFPTVTTSYDRSKKCKDVMVAFDSSCPEDSSSSSSSGMSGGAIAGVVIGIITGVALLVALVFVLIRRHGDKTGSSRFYDDNEGEQSTAKGDGGVELVATAATSDDYSEDQGENDDSQEIDDQQV